jgi:hypothetical protein
MGFRRFMAAQLTRMSSRPNASKAFDSSQRRFEVPELSREAHGLSPCPSNLLRDPLQPFPGPRVQGDRGAVTRKRRG